jgi:three-Cys-motif partner protein
MLLAVGAACRVLSVATGADENFWRDARLRSVLKHGIIKRYLPVFLARTSARRGKAVYFDGYAGRGRYENGQLGSSGLMMEFALEQKSRLGRDYTLLLHERDRESFDSLAALAEQYRERGLDVRPEQTDVASVIDDVLRCRVPNTKS